MKSTPIIAFFNSKAGVGKTKLVYHLSWMYADLGARVLAADLDPQADLTTSFLDQEQLESLWRDGSHPKTISGCLDSLRRQADEISQPHFEDIGEGVALILGDLNLSNFEDYFSDVWPGCLEGDAQSFRATAAFWRIMQLAAERHHADLVLADLGPNVGAMNRAALIASDYVVVPVSPDIFALPDLAILGSKLSSWRSDWKKRLAGNSSPAMALPDGKMQPIGYVVPQRSVRLDKPGQSYDAWIKEIPDGYQREVLKNSTQPADSPANDPNCLALLKNYPGLDSIAQEAHKPIFHLKPADGAVGSYFKAAGDVRAEYAQLASRIAERSGVILDLVEVWQQSGRF